MLLKYEDIILTDIEGIADYLKEGKARSFPIPILNKNEVRDIYFIFTALRRNAFIAPSGRLCIDPILKKIEWYASSAEKTFSYVSNSEVQYEQMRTFNEIEEHVELYRTLYPQVRIFAFADVLSSEEKKILKMYKSTFDILIDESQKVLYNDLSPDFFKWMETHIN